ELPVPGPDPRVHVDPQLDPPVEVVAVARHGVHHHEFRLREDAVRRRPRDALPVLHLVAGGGAVLVPDVAPAAARGPTRWPAVALDRVGVGEPEAVPDPDGRPFEVLGLALEEVAVV